MLIPKDEAITLTFWLIDTTGTEYTGSDPLVDISKNGGAWTRTTNSATSVGRGLYKITLTASETDTAGPLNIMAYVEGTDTTYPNRDTDYYTWRDTHDVYTAVNAQTGSGVEVAATLSDAERNEVANFVLRRDLTEVLALTNASDGVDAKTGLSLLGLAALQLFPRAAEASPQQIKVYEDDGSTTFFTMTINGLDTTTSLPDDIAIATDPA